MSVLTKRTHETDTGPRDEGPPAEPADTTTAAPTEAGADDAAEQAAAEKAARKAVKKAAKKVAKKAERSAAEADAVAPADESADEGSDETAAAEESTTEATPDRPEPRGAAGAVAAVVARLRAVRLPSSRRGRIVLAAVLTVIVLLTAGGLTRWWTHRLPDGVAYRAAGQDVTVEQVEHQMDTLSALYGMTKPADPAALDGFRRDFAKASVIGLLLEQAARSRDIVVADKAAQDFLSRYVDKYFGPGTDARAKFVAALGNVGTSETAVLEEIKRQMAASRLFDQVTANVAAVPDADVDAAFGARKDQLGTPEKRTVSNIVVADQATAQQVVAELKGGAGFADVARRRSGDASTKNAGGTIGSLTAAQLEKPFADAAFGAPQGVVFGPVQTSHGWNVGVVTAVQAAVPADPKTVREPLRTTLLLERKADVWRAFLADLIAAADARYADDFRPADPDGVPAVPTGANPAAVPVAAPN